MSRNSKPLVPLSDAENKFMVFLFKSFYLEMLNKAKKYVDDIEIAHDVVINSFEIAARRNSVVIINNIKGFLYVIIAHDAVRARKKRMSQLHQEEPLPGDNGCRIPCGTDGYSMKHYTQAENSLQQCIQRMTPGQSGLYNLIVNNKKSYREIAAVTNKTVDQIKANWWVVKKKISQSICQ